MPFPCHLGGNSRKHRQEKLWPLKTNKRRETFWYAARELPTPEVVTKEVSKLDPYDQEASVGLTN